MKKLFNLLAIAAVLLVAASCSKNEKRTADISGMDIDFHITRYDSLFWNIDTAQVNAEFLRLDSLYPGMTEIYISHVMMMGKLDDPQAAVEYNNFHRYPAVVAVHDSVFSAYSDISDIEAELKPAILRMQSLLPHIQIPEFYTHVSFFNQNIIVGDGFISLSLDNYLGPDFSLYDSAGIYTYLRPNMRREKIATDYITAIISSEYLSNPSANLLSDMIYCGKVLYATSCMFPDVDDAIIMGYTPDQLDWARTNESELWRELVESHVIYTTNVIDKNKFTHDGPFTQPFGQESPSRLGAYIGWQIVRSYMRHNQDVTLIQLMQDNNAQEILNKSNYK